MYITARLWIVPYSLQYSLCYNELYCTIQFKVQRVYNTIKFTVECTLSNTKMYTALTQPSPSKPTHPASPKTGRHSLKTTIPGCPTHIVLGRFLFWNKRDQNLYHLSLHSFCSTISKCVKFLEFQPILAVLGFFSLKNPAYGRHQLSRPMRIVRPIQFWRGCVIYLYKKK